MTEPEDYKASNPTTQWLGGLRLYLSVIAIGNLAWEALHLPLYTIWTTGTATEQAFAVLHCTLGDILIAASTLVAALLVAGSASWPARNAWRVAAIAITLGVTYTVYSEWTNVYVRAAWGYSELMPIVAVYNFRIGVSPLLQWIVLPITATWIILRQRMQLVRTTR